jgi:hypothetical protein
VKFLFAWLRRYHVYGYLRISRCHTVNDSGDEPSRKRIRTTDTNLASGGIAQEFDVSNSLFEFVENNLPALQQGSRVYCWLNPAGAAIQEWNLQNAFQAGYCFGHGWL